MTNRRKVTHRREPASSVSYLAAALVACALGGAVASACAESDTVTATIDGRHWDKAFVGGRTVDAVHRSVLLRYPGPADAFAAALSQGRDHAKAEHAFTYHAY